MTKDPKQSPLGDRDDKANRSADSAAHGDSKTDGRSDIDQGAYDDGNAGPRTEGEGVYREGQDREGQETLGQTPDDEADGAKGRDRGADGGGARANRYGNTGGERYGGGGPNGGTRGDPERPTP